MFIIGQIRFGGNSFVGRPMNQRPWPENWICFVLLAQFISLLLLMVSDATTPCGRRACSPKKVESACFLWAICLTPFFQRKMGRTGQAYQRGQSWKCEVQQMPFEGRSCLEEDGWAWATHASLFFPNLSGSELSPLPWSRLNEGIGKDCLFYTPFSHSLVHPTYILSGVRHSYRCWECKDVYDAIYL